MKALFAIAIVTSVFFAGTTALAQSQSPMPTPPRITQLMSSQDLLTTGLGSLSSTQIDELSVWLDSYRSSAEWLALAAARGEGMETVGEHVIDTFIDGDFDGWVGDTVFRLGNGQIWQQTSPSARYLFAHSPRVTISLAPYFMRVDGLAVEIAVRRLR